MGTLVSWVNALFTEPEVYNSMPSTHMIEGEN